MSDGNIDSELEVNKYIDYSRCMIKQIDHIKKINDNLSDIKTLIFAGMLSYYGIDCLDDIYIAFLRTNFVSCEKDISEVISSEYNVDFDLIKNASKHCPGTFYLVDGVKNLLTNKYFFQRSIFISQDINLSDLIIGVTHQLNHVINSLHHPILRKRDSYGSRMGVCFEHFDSRRIELLDLEEAINILQVADIINEFERFSYYDINDSGVKAVCDSCFHFSLDKHFNNELVEIIKPLYDDRWFRQVLFDARYNGILTDIRDEFESKVGLGSYTCFIRACDRISYLDSNVDSDEKTKAKIAAKLLVKTYVNKHNN